MITLKEILGSDSFGGMRGVINSNFNIVKNGLNSILNSIDIGESGIITMKDNNITPKIILDFTNGSAQFTSVSVKTDSDVSKNIVLNNNSFTTGSSIKVVHNGDVDINNKLTCLNLKNTGVLNFNVLKTTPIPLVVTASTSNDLLVYANSNFQVGNYSHIVVSGGGFGAGKLFPLDNTVHGHILFVQNKTGVSFDIICKVTTFNNNGDKSTVPSGYLTGYYTVNANSITMLMYTEINSIKSWTKLN